MEIRWCKHEWEVRVGMCGQGKGDLYEVLLSQSGQDMFSGVWFCAYQPGDGGSILMGKTVRLAQLLGQGYPVWDVDG